MDATILLRGVFWSLIGISTLILGAWIAFTPAISKDHWLRHGLWGRGTDISGGL